MEKIIVSMANPDAIEVRENQRLDPRYGDGTHSTFPGLKLKESKVLYVVNKLLEAHQLPLIIQKSIELGAFDKEEDKDAKLDAFFVVLLKAKNLLDEGFHVLIISSMLGCACGHESKLGYGAFDEKFTRAFTDPEVRKDFWGTEYLLPIELVRAVLLDLMMFFKS